MNKNTNTNPQKRKETFRCTNRVEIARKDKEKNQFKQKKQIFYA